LKKQRHNGKRNPHPPAVPPAATNPQEKTPTPPPAETSFDPAMVEHLRVATSLIEGRKVTRQEVIEMLQRNLSQHSMVTDPPAGYGEGGNKPPPP
jgi:hypothetical protein